MGRLGLEQKGSSVWIYLPPPCGIHIELQIFWVIFLLLEQIRCLMLFQSLSHDCHSNFRINPSQKCMVLFNLVHICECFHLNYWLDVWKNLFLGSLIKHDTRYEPGLFHKIKRYIVHPINTFSAISSQSCLSKPYMTFFLLLKTTGDFFFPYNESEWSNDKNSMIWYVSKVVIMHCIPSHLRWCQTDWCGQVACSVHFLSLVLVVQRSILTAG